MSHNSQKTSQLKILYSHGAQIGGIWVFADNMSNEYTQNGSIPAYHNCAVVLLAL